jgi:hypothetical protein
MRRSPSETSTARTSATARTPPPSITASGMGEELRASPPRRVREITIKNTAPRVVKCLFSAGIAQPKAPYTSLRLDNSGQSSKGHCAQSDTKESGQGTGAGKLKEIISNELVLSVQDMQMACPSPNRSWMVRLGGAKERVSFGMDVSSLEESRTAVQCNRTCRTYSPMGQFSCKEVRNKDICWCK